MKNKNRNDKLFQDLFRMGDYSGWAVPKQPENIQWFNLNGKTDIKNCYQNEELIKDRMLDLVKLGANIEDKAYLVANVNRSNLLEYAYSLGANPNIKGKTGMSLCDRALSRGRTDIVRITINNPLFNFEETLIDGDNLLFSALSKGRTDLASDIIESYPKLATYVNQIGISPLHKLGDHLAFKSNASLNKCLTLANKILLKMHEDGIFPNPNTSSIDLNSFIAEKNSLYLSKSLPEKENKTSNKFKL